MNRAADEGAGFCVKPQVVGPLQTNCYVLCGHDTGEAVLIDPGAEGERLAALVTELGLRLTAIFLTHGHFDHIAGLSALKAVHDAPVFMHADDERQLDLAAPLAEQWGFNIDPSPLPDRYLEHGDQVPCGAGLARVIHVPGHSPGSVALHVGEDVFVGDTLFAGSIGRSDLPGGSHQVLIESIRSRILTLGDEVRVWPGHGPATSVGRERTTNPFFADIDGPRDSWMV